MSNVNEFGGFGASNRGPKFHHPDSAPKKPEAETPPKPEKKVETETPQPEVKAEASKPEAPEVKTPEAKKPEEEKPTAEAPKIDWEKLTGGRVKSEEDFKNVLSNNEEYQKRLDELAKEKESLSARLSEDPFADEFTKNLNELIKSGADKEQVRSFVQMQFTDIETMDAMTAKKLRLMSEKNYSEQEAMDAINLEFPLDEDEMTEREIERTKKRLELSSKEDKAWLKERQSTIGSNLQETQRKQQEQWNNYQTEVEKWVPEATSGLSGVGEMVLGSIAEGEEVKYAIEYPDDFKKVIPEIAKNFILANRLKPSAETRKAVQDHVKMVYVANNFEGIIKNAVTDAIGKANEYAVKKYGNIASRHVDRNGDQHGGDGYANYTRKYAAGSNRAIPLQ